MFRTTLSLIKSLDHPVHKRKYLRIFLNLFKVPWMASMSAYLPMARYCVCVVCVCVCVCVLGVGGGSMSMPIVYGLTYPNRDMYA